MFVVDFLLSLLRHFVRLLLGIGHALGTESAASAQARRLKAPAPVLPAAWLAQARALDEHTAQLDDASEALQVADALQTAVGLFAEFRTFYLSVRADDTTPAEAAADFLRLVIPIIFQIYLRDGTNSKLAVILPLFIILDRRMAEASSDSTFDERIARWLGATWSAVTDADGDGKLDRAESVAAALSILMAAGTPLWRRLAVPKAPWLQTLPDDWRAIYRVGFDDVGNEWPPAEHRALARGMTTYFPPATGPFLDEAAFKVLDTPPRPWVESGASFTILPVPAQLPTHGGAVALYVEGDFNRKEQSEDGRHRFEVEVEPGFTALLPVAEPLLAGANPALRARMAYVMTVPPDGRTGSGLSLHLDELRLEAVIEAAAQQPTLTLTAALRGLELSASGLLPFRGRADLLLRYDTRTQQLTFEGGVGLEVRKRLAVGAVKGADGKPTGDAFAEATLLARLALQQGAAGFDAHADLLADVTLRIGRFATVAVAGTGVRLLVRSAPDGDGRLIGLFDADMQGVPPTGIGLAISAGPVQGGGMLRVGGGRVTGVVELALGKKFRLTGIGQYESRERWLGLVTFERATPGPPFLPQGIGLLVARGRRVDADALRAALGSGEIDLVLMPRDVVANESRIMAALDKFFPPGPAMVLGAMARFESKGGTFSARIGVLAELPYDDRGSLELHLLAVAQLKVPSQRPWTLEGVGLWNFGRSEGYLLLQLRDARIWGVEMTGSALIFHGDPDGDGPVGKGTWISLGGFFPGYAVPGPALGGMKRIGFIWTKGDSLRLEASGYLAWTPSSLQFGIAASLHAGYFGFSFDGGISFDALVAFDWSCQIDFHAHLTFKVLGRTLAGFGVDCTYSATDRYRLVGAAHYEFLWFSGTKHFSCDLGARDAPRLPVAEIEQALAAELQRPAAWRVPVVAGVALVERERGITLPPDGRTHFEQDIVPLNVTIDLFGAQRIATPRAFTVEAAPIGGTPLARTVRVGEFAPGLYFDMTQDEALRAPVVVQHDNGFEFALPLQGGAARDVDEDWEEVVIDPHYVPLPTVPPPDPHTPPRGPRVLVRPLDVAFAEAPVRPVQVHAAAYRGAGSSPVTWMRAWSAARLTPPAAPLAAATDTAVPTGIVFMRVAAPAAPTAPVRAVLTEAWR